MQYLLEMLGAWVPLPAPGGPMRTIRGGLLEEEGERAAVTEEMVLETEVEVDFSSWEILSWSWAQKYQ